MTEGTRTCNSMGACKTKRGETCSVKEDCITDNCVDGVCCESACTGACEACGETDRKGTCVAVTGQPRGDRTKCPGNGTACGGACDGANRTACGYPGATTTCGPPSGGTDVVRPPTRTREGSW